ncbi:hypothetical protein EW146_g1864 [Bondarzewia mesenterica]|uniref:Fungal STAND N-terminal Goodbye domain-containing protein n=1 Tax=Bondarzewia mesenterica TaxID=1095465 RepID=A0A4S4M2K7_9AGAM|nr:hypothetical protein EW146_g1864 [Bondarzewia mesenterica]
MPSNPDTVTIKVRQLSASASGSVFLHFLSCCNIWLRLLLITDADIESATRVMGDAFRGDVFTGFSAGESTPADGKDRSSESLVRSLHRAQIRAALIGGRVYVAEAAEVNDAIVGAAVWFGPGEDLLGSPGQAEAGFNQFMEALGKKDPYMPAWWMTYFLPKYSAFTTEALGDAQFKHDGWHLQLIGVLPACQRHGVSSALVVSGSSTKNDTEAPRSSLKMSVETETESAFHAIWQEAIFKYESDTGIKVDLSSSSPFATVDSPDAVLQLVDEEQKKFNEHRKSGEKVRDVLKPMLHVVCSFANAAGQGASLAFPPSTAIFGAVVVLLRAAEGVSSGYDAISQILQDLDDFLDRFKIHLDHDITRSIQEMMVKILAHLLMILGLVTKSVKEDRVGESVASRLTSAHSCLSVQRDTSKSHSLLALLSDDPLFLVYQAEQLVPKDHLRRPLSERPRAPGTASPTVQKNLRQGGAMTGVPTSTGESVPSSTYPHPTRNMVKYRVDIWFSEMSLTLSEQSPSNFSKSYQPCQYLCAGHAHVPTDRIYAPSGQRSGGKIASGLSTDLFFSFRERPTGWLRLRLAIRAQSSSVFHYDH